MSIPKEPRQLMINLMYLVLTALLALNVSAEVMNAFFTLEKGIKASGEVVAESNNQLLGAISSTAEAYANGYNDSVLLAANRVNEISKEFVQYMEDIHGQLFEAAGGPSDDDPNKPKRKKDKDVTTRLLVAGPAETPEDDGIGFEMKDRISATRDSFLYWIRYVGGEEAVQEVANSIPLEVDESWKEKSKDKKSSWADYNFRQMPVAAVFPMLRKWQSDAKASAASSMNYFLKQMGAQDIKFDQFFPVAAAKKGYVIRGEEYEADIFLSAYSSSAGENTRIFVNGNQMAMEDGRATYKTTTRGLGEQSYKVRIEVENPLTGEVESYDNTFNYEVGERSVTVSAEKMNVFYIGVDNPVAVSAAGISSNELSVSVSGGGGSIRKAGNSKYIVNVSQPTDDCRINVSGGGMRDSKLFRVKRIPDPVARLGNKQDGSMGNGEFKAQGGVIAWLDNFDFDAKCDIQGFKLVRVPKRQDPIEVMNSGARYGADSKRIVGQARPGDTFYFFDVKARCPGDKAGRKINSMVFTIK
jgi:gliding motility-associated protein GldM